MGVATAILASVMRAHPFRSRASFALPLLVATLVVLSTALANATPACRDLPELTRLLLRKHVQHRSITPELRDRTVQNFLRRLDSQRVLFLDAQAQVLERDLRNVFHEIGAGDCSRLRGTHQEILQRLRALENFMRDFVGDPNYALDESVTLVIDPKKRGYPETPAQRETLLRTLAHFQISNYLGGGITLPEAQERLIQRYERSYRRTAEFTEEEIFALFLDSFGHALDPYTQFFPPEVLEDFRIRMELSLEGIGVSLFEDNGFTVVRDIIPGGATDRAKALEPDDRIIAVAEDGQTSVDIIDMALRDVVRLIRGKKGTRVQLTVLRGDSERLQVTITRDKIDLAEQAARLEIEEVEVEGQTLKLGLLELPAFYGNSASAAAGSEQPGNRQGSTDVKQLIAQARREQVDGLLLDLSRNSGGLLEDAVRITGFFLREGSVVAVNTFPDKRDHYIYRDQDAAIHYDGPLVILTSRLSASASEILAGAMKDYRRAVVVGDGQTFGKGSVQRLIPLRSAPPSALKVTTTLFYRPSGRSTQRAGVVSDVVLPSLLANPRIGENVHENALPGDAIEDFRTPVEPVWKPVDDTLLEELARRSTERVGSDAEFQELLAEIAEREQDDGRVTLSEINRKRKEAEAAAKVDVDGNVDVDVDGKIKASAASEAAPLAGAPGADPLGADEDESEELTLHQREALRILADLVALAQ